MRGHWLNRGLLAVAGVVVVLTTAAASLAAAPGYRFAGLYDQTVLLDPAVAPANVLRNPLEEVTGSFALDDTLWLDTGFNADVARLLDRFAPGANGFDGLFYSDAVYGSTYTGLSSGGSFAGLHAKLMQGIDFSLGLASSEPGLNRYRVDPHSAYAALGGRLPLDLRYTQSVLAGLNWNFARWGGVGFTAARIDERGGALGLSNPALGARTQALGVTAHVNFGGGWVTTASYNEGLTQLALRPGALSSSVRTESFGVAVAKHGLFKKNDAFGVAFAQPAPAFAGLTPADKSSDLQFFGRDKLLSTMAKETDIELGYKTEFFGDSIALQANASYQMNSGGVTGRDSVSLLSKAKIKF